MINLSIEFSRLNEHQKIAVSHDDNTAVLAGPGSGKTATIVLKIAHLLEDILPPFGALACITYNNEAVREIKKRLVELAIYPGRRLFLGTVHSFCLNCILRPYAGLVMPMFHKEVVVASSKYSEILLDRALARAGVSEKASYYSSTLTRLRRSKICDEDITGFDDSDLNVLSEYEALLAAEKLVDFESMVGIAAEILTKHDWARNLVTARFPWVVVDEYQDLGGPLHKIVTTVSKSGTKIFAVGDPDQTIYNFTGAHPKYLDQLSERSDFKTIRLKFNYRSGRKLIDAGQAALSPNEPREYKPDPKRQDQGEVFLLHASEKDQAREVIRAVQQALNDGIRPEEIAILYLKKNVLLSELRAELENNRISYLAERDSKYPSSPTIRWLQDSAAWAVAAPSGREHLFEDLLRQYTAILVTSGQIEGYSAPLEVRLRLFEALSEPIGAEMKLRDWLERMDRSLSLRLILGLAEDYVDDLASFSELLELTGDSNLLANVRITDFASEGRMKGKVVLTTFHSSKGRQFDLVIIPGLAEGLLPEWKWNPRKRKYDEPTRQSLIESRRLFYVGFTRARKSVCLVCSDSFRNRGYLNSLGVSRFATEIRKQLEANY